MVAKFCPGLVYKKKFSRFFQPFRRLLPSKFVKSANMIKKNYFLQNAIWVNKKEFDAGFESVAKSCKNLHA
jgi:hypothetical protein